MSSAQSGCALDLNSGPNSAPGAGAAGPHPATWREVGGSGMVGLDVAQLRSAVWELGFENLAEGTGGSINCHCPHGTKFPDTWGVPGAQDHGSVIWIWP